MHVDGQPRVAVHVAAALQQSTGPAGILSQNPAGAGYLCAAHCCVWPLRLLTVDC
jgi:hypothetical protein